MLSPSRCYPAAAANAVVDNLAGATTSTPPSHIVNLAAAATSTPPARAVNPSAAFAGSSTATTAALTASSPRTPPSPCPRRAELPPPPPSLITSGSATTGTGLPPTTAWTPASRNRGVDLAASASGASGGDASDAPPRPASPLGANLFSYTSFVDTLIRPTASLASPVAYTGAVAAAVSAPSSPMGYVSPSLFKGRNSPRSTSDDILAEGEGGDEAMELGGSRSSTTATGRGRLGYRVSRGGRHTHRRAGPRSKLMPQQDIWSRESFMYICALMIFAGLVAYLGTMIEGWFSYVRVIFIMIFGVATGLACIGAMALISETPVPSPRHFAPIASRLTFLIDSIAFEGAIFFLLGEIGFITWLLVAAGTVFGMAYFWRAGHPESLATLISGLSSIPTLLQSLFDSMLALFRRG
ncbi:uncharacterized protein LOC133892012 isoform X2 [Phragmites australis]|uniref:uncharacterized protein LOC133892012 isoform X2 n=1 Tax=Phragmites australis TaxID=29695 RepID=UPI002D77CEFA|nr:uncharacterized protein LOC133892012 isoform X2 [Phragmites australis]